MYNKQFWETFIEKNGSEFDSSENRLFYLYSEEFDSEEDKVSITILTESVLEVKIYQIHTEEEKKNNESEIELVDSIEFEYVKMDSIKSVRYVLYDI